MKKDLLITIACHYNHPNEERFDFLWEVLKNIQDNYKCDFDIIIDTNSAYLAYTVRRKNVTMVLHENLEHPFHLTWCHRQHIKDNIDNYENFLYTEDDMMLSFENYLNYLENFKLLWPEFVPSFIRVEKHDDEDFVADIHNPIHLNMAYAIGGKRFAELKPLDNYSAMWLMPQKELKESMKDDFVKLSDGREFAASYVAWTLEKPTLVETENLKVSTKCYSYHLPNNAPNVNLKVGDIFI